MNLTTLRLIARRRLVALSLALALTGCEGKRVDAGDMVVAGGSRERGAEVIRYIGCGACHTIPGIEDATATVGPPLVEFAQRSFIAGSLPNAPDNLVRWIMDPEAIEPGTAMPRLGLSRGQAGDVAAYLYALR